MLRSTTIELNKDEFNFSAGHFTIFSATEREDLHGHNYYVSAAISCKVKEEGLSFDYRFYKKKLLELCKKLDLRFLLPEFSKYLKIEDAGDMWFAHFNNEKIPFLKRDVLILPVSNVTLEELSFWFLQHLIEDKNQLKEHLIDKIKVCVYNGPSQSGSSEWSLALQPEQACLSS